MKKFFKFALVAFAAVAVVACQKPAANNTPAEEGGQQGGGDKVLNSLTVAPATLELEVGATGNLTVTLDPADFSKEGLTWTSSNTAVATVANGVVTAVAAGEANIKAALGGKEGTCKVTVKAAAPAGQSWDYVMDIHDYKTNSEFHFENAKKFNPASLTVQWKFMATKWNDYDKVDEERGYKVYCNRLGQICNESEKGLLFRFNDGGKKGQLRLGSPIFSKEIQYINKGEEAYIWSLDEWHVFTLTSDGTTVTVYDNAEVVNSYELSASPVFAEWPVQRFDISMTWDEGDVYVKGQAFLGYQAYTRLWSKALSADEVAASLCDVPADSEGLEIYWAWNNDEGTTVDNLGKAGAAYNLDFTKALAGGQASFVKAEDIEGTWTPAGTETVPAVCAAE